MKTAVRFIGGVMCSFIVIMFIASSVKAEDEVFPICGWTKWINPPNSGSINVSEDWSNRSITLSGKFTEDAGYVVERDFDFGGKTLTLEIFGTKDCTFDSGKLFKLEVNGRGNALIPIEKGRKNVNDPDFINPGDGSVSFKLPENVKKIEFVFWKADLKNLKISGKLSPQQ